MTKNYMTLYDGECPAAAVPLMLYVTVAVAVTECTELYP